MSKRGRKATPTKLKLLRGNPGKRAITHDEPQPKVARPRMPAVVARIPKAKACWEWLIRELEDMGTLTTAEGKILELYAVTYFQWRTAVEFIHKNGPTYAIKAGPTTAGGKTKQGQVKSVGQYPQVSIASSTVKTLGLLGAELGLSPASRTRIKTPTAQEPENPLLELVKQAAARRKSG